MHCTSSSASHICQAEHDTVRVMIASAVLPLATVWRTMFPLGCPGTPLSTHAPSVPDPTHMRTPTRLASPTQVLHHALNSYPTPICARLTASVVRSTLPYTCPPPRPARLPYSSALYRLGYTPDYIVYHLCSLARVAHVTTGRNQLPYTCLPPRLPYF